MKVYVRPTDFYETIREAIFYTNLEEAKRDVEISGIDKDAVWEHEDDFYCILGRDHELHFIYERTFD